MSALRVARTGLFIKSLNTVSTVKLTSSGFSQPAFSQSQSHGESKSSSASASAVKSVIQSLLAGATVSEANARK